MVASIPTKIKYLIMLCGLPGTGKTFLAGELNKGLKKSIIIDQNEIRRKLGMKKMPKTQEETLRAVDRLAARCLTRGMGVIIDSVNRHTFRRQQLYGVASACGVRVITFEVICSEKTAKSRMRKRDKSDGLLSDPNNIKVYDKIKALWEDVSIDFKYPGEDHVSWVKFDTDRHKLKSIIARIGDKKFIDEIRKILE